MTQSNNGAFTEANSPTWGHDVPLRQLLTTLLDAHLSLSRGLIDSLSKPLVSAPTLPSHLPQPQSASTAHLLQALTQVDAQLQQAITLGKEHAQLDGRVTRLCERVAQREDKVRQAQRQLGMMKRDMDRLVSVAMDTRRNAEKAMSNPLDSNIILTHAATLAQTTSAPAHLLSSSSVILTNSSALVESEQQPAQQLAASGATSGLPQPTETQLRSGALGARPPTWSDFLAGSTAKVEEETRNEAYGGGASAWGATQSHTVADEDAFELDLN